MIRKKEKDSPLLCRSTTFSSFQASFWLILGILNPLLPHFIPLLPRFGPLLTHLRPPLAHLGPLLALPGPPLAHPGLSWLVLGLAWLILDLSRPILSLSWHLSWLILGLSGLSWTLPWLILGLTRPVLKKNYFKGGGGSTPKLAFRVGPPSIFAILISIFRRIQEAPFGLRGNGNTIRGDLQEASFRD